MKQTLYFSALLICLLLSTTYAQDVNSPLEIIKKDCKNQNSECYLDAINWALKFMPDNKDKEELIVMQYLCGKVKRLMGYSHDSYPRKCFEEAFDDLDFAGKINPNRLKLDIRILPANTEISPRYGSHIFYSNVAHYVYDGYNLARVNDSDQLFEDYGDILKVDGKQAGKRNFKAGLEMAIERGNKEEIIRLRALMRKFNPEEYRRSFSAHDPGQERTTNNSRTNGSEQRDDQLWVRGNDEVERTVDILSNSTLQRAVRELDDN